MTANRARTMRLVKLAVQMNEQLEWIKKCGGNLVGYLQRYGVQGNYKRITALGGRDKGKKVIVPAWSGNGGHAIYAADMGELDRIAGLMR